MDDSIKALNKERNDNEIALYTGKMPTRVPIKVNIGFDVIAEYAGLDLKSTLWDVRQIYDKALELCERIFSDSCLLGNKSRMPAYYEALGSKNCVMSSNGFMQHPDTFALYSEEYDEFIKNPIDTIVEKVIPRNYRRLDFTKNPGAVLFTITEADYQKSVDSAGFREMSGKLNDKFGYTTTQPGTFGACYATMDLLTDNIRSLTEMSKDIRRMPDKVLEAVNALYPVNYVVGKVARPSVTSMVDYPLHLPMFMRQKDFEKLWWPSWKRQCEDYASLDIKTGAFCEADWTRYLDFLQELPENSRLKFEYGDPKLFKDKIGNKHVMVGMFPLKYLTALNKQQCIDKTKEWLDIMAPGGRYAFTFDKSMLMLSDVNFDNLEAICETVRTYGVYDNPGASNGAPVLDPKNYTHSYVPEVKSKYLVDWEEYKKYNPYAPDNAKARVETVKVNTIKAIAGLLR